ncbi:hypothetical protein RJ640_022697 [Escallonia rubra]|uniref:Alpha-1,6-glucosidases pullulanase-type C-terminal domain-containing protein n=1 Tax=Escallonia rubra TaxID=112253 RepID=A0AA88S7Q4_9ASTE|nr:hypothetical protein RJ640_022697 [Escallonia rubra]
MCPTDVSFPSAALKAKAFQLHPVQMMSTDNTVKKSVYDASSGCFTVPPRTTSVFVEPRNTKESARQS